MTRAAIIRCEKNEQRCPLTICLNCLLESKECFAMYGDCKPVRRLWRPKYVEHI